MNNHTDIPSDTDLEKALIGLCIESGANYESAKRIIPGDTAKVFHAVKNARYMVAIDTIMGKGGGVDTMSLKIELSHRKLWTDESIDDLAEFIEAASLSRAKTVTAIAEELLELHSRRSLIQTCTEAIQKAYDRSSDIKEAAGSINLAVARMQELSVQHQIRSIGELYPEFLNHLAETQKAISSGERDIIGQSSGISILDYYTGGDVPGDLVVIAARPGEGKSTIVLQMAKAGALRNDPQVVFSLEMDDYMQVGRAAADITSIPNNLIQQAKLKGDHWLLLQSVSDEIAKLPIYLEFVPSLDIHHLEARIRYCVKVLGVKRAFIDYLQLMDSPTNPKERIAAENQNAKISVITKRLKQLAGELGIPIVLLSQMSRDVEKRPGEKIPIKSDLRDSGSIEQDASKIFFLYSPFSYEDSIPGYCQRFYPKVSLEYMRRLTFIIIAKGRNAPLVRVPIWNDRKFCRMSDIRSTEVYEQLDAMQLLDNNEQLMAKLGIHILGKSNPVQTEMEFEANDSTNAADLFPF